MIFKIEKNEFFLCEKWFAWYPVFIWGRKGLSDRYYFVWLRLIWRMHVGDDCGYVYAIEKPKKWRSRK
jgi:hypothetical protein